MGKYSSWGRVGRRTLPNKHRRSAPRGLSRLRRLGVEPLEARLVLDAATGREAAPELFSTMPALFVENQGQWADESVRFVHDGAGVDVAPTDTGPVFQLSRRVCETTLFKVNDLPGRGPSRHV